MRLLQSTAHRVAETSKLQRSYSTHLQDPRTTHVARLSTKAARTYNSKHNSKQAFASQLQDPASYTQHTHNRSCYKYCQLQGTAWHAGTACCSQSFLVTPTCTIQLGSALHPACHPCSLCTPLVYQFCSSSVRLSLASYIPAPCGSCPRCLTPRARPRSRVSQAIPCQSHLPLCCCRQAETD